MDAKETHRSAALMSPACLSRFAAIPWGAFGAPEPLALSLMIPLRDWLPASARSGRWRCICP
jgi:hypothetical protein